MIVLLSDSDSLTIRKLYFLRKSIQKDNTQSVEFIFTGYVTKPGYTVADKYNDQ